MQVKLNCNSCINGNCNECNTEDCLCREDHGKREIIKAFTDAANRVLAQNPEELKKRMRRYKQSLEFDVDKAVTVDADKKEFNRDTKGGFYVYEDKNDLQSFSKDFVSDIMLPAHVYNGKESCGKWKIAGCLQDHLHKEGGGYISKRIMRCNNKGCRKCATSAIKREARAITNRLMTFCNLKNNRKVYLKKNRARILHHDVVSIPYNEQSLFLTKDGRKKLRSKALKILKQFDIDGGVMIDHPYRFTEGLESARFSPHLHLIVTGWLDGQLVKQVYEETNWIIKNVSVLESFNDCYNLSKYLLSHSAVFMKQEGKRSSEHSVRYFGECHNKKFKVQGVLKYSITGYDQLDSIISDRKETKVKKEFYPLQRVSYTHSIIEEQIKDVENIYFEEYVNGNHNSLAKSLRRFIDTRHKDNPAIPQSDPPSMGCMEFLQMRFEYGLSQFDIVQSVYVSIILDPSIDCLCPECTVKMETLTPPDTGWSDDYSEMMANLLKELPENVVIPIDDISQFSYLRDTKISQLGMPFFNSDGILEYDTGIYQRPDNFDSLNPKLYWSIIKNINTQKVKYIFKLQNGRSPNKEEIEECLDKLKPEKIPSQSLLNF